MTSSRCAYRVAHLERLPLRTPYTAQLGRLFAIKNLLPRAAQVIMDVTGVGKALFDLAVEQNLDPIGVVIHSGFEVHRRPYDNTVTVPKMRIVSELDKRLQSGDLFVHESLKDWPALRRELLNFRPELTRAGTETWNARSGEHDDLVLALGLALFQLTGEHVRYRGLMEFYARDAGEPGAGAEWAIGVDVGQNVDPTAIAVVSKVTSPSALTHHEAA
jgi:hypothetical protein